MSTYLLLRDNKESGPYSLDELRTKGLKAYDLVWIEGRSAAWRYPSEVEELKSFAPVVEEQPFDRFFKKPAQSNSSISIQPRAAAEKESSFSQGVNGSGSTGSGSNGSKMGEPSTIPGKRIIYVTLPAGRAATAMRDSSIREPFRPQAPVAAIAVLETKTPLTDQALPRVEPPARHIPVSTPIEEKFSHGNEDMWTSTAEINPRRNRPNLKRFLQPVAAIVTILALLAAGVFIGLSIKSDAFGFSERFGANAGTNPVPVTVVHTDPTISQPPPVVQTATVATVNPDPNANINKENSAATPNSLAVNRTNTLVPPATGQTATTVAATPAPAIAVTPAPVVRKRSDRAKDRAAMNAQKLAVLNGAARDSASMGLPVLNREAAHRTDDIPADKDAVKSSISNMISIGAGKYTVGTFGGISDVQLTVSNHSPYPIDLVVVEVQYVQANKKVFKTENMYFRGVAPGAALMEEAPKSTRGVKIQYRITLINSKELGLSYSAI